MLYTCTCRTNTPSFLKPKFQTCYGQFIFSGGCFPGITLLWSFCCFLNYVAANDWFRNITKIGTWIRWLVFPSSVRSTSTGIHPLYGIWVPFAALKWRSVSIKSLRYWSGTSERFSFHQLSDMIDTWAPVSQRAVTFLPFIWHWRVHLEPTNLTNLPCCLGVRWQICCCWIWDTSPYLISVFPNTSSVVLVLWLGFLQVSWDFLKVVWSTSCPPEVTFARFLLSCIHGHNDCCLHIWSSGCILLPG